MITRPLPRPFILSSMCSIALQEGAHLNASQNCLYVVPHDVPNSSYRTFSIQILGRAEVEEDDREQARFLDGGKAVGGAIGACGSGIGDSLLVALYACITFIYGSSWKGEMARKAKRYLDKSSEGLGEVFLGEAGEYPSMAWLGQDIGFKEGKLTRPYSSKGKKMSSMGELTFFLGLQVQQKKDGTFISQYKYVDKILKKFGFTEVKTASTPMETQKPLLKDEDGEEVDVHMYRSMIGSLMYLTSSRPDIMFPVCACARYQVNPKVSHLHAVKRIFSDYAGASLDRKFTTEGKAKKSVRLMMEKFFGMELELMLAKTINGEVQLHAIVDEKKIIINESTVRRDLQLEDVEDEAIHKELGDSLVRAATIDSSLEAEQDSGGGQRACGTKKGKTHRLKRLHKVGMSRRVESSGDEDSLGEDASKQGRRINAIDADEDITLVNVQDDAEMFDVNTLTGDEVFPKQEVAAKDVNLTIDEVTLAQALVALKSVKPKDKGKGIMVEEPVQTMKKNDLIRLDKETAKRLQAEFDEEERLAREKDEANVNLIKEWDDIQAKIEGDHELARRLQAEEQEGLYVEEKEKLFQQLLEQRRKHFAAKSAEEKRNKPPTQAQQRKIMCTYLKNMKGKKPKYLKNKSFDSIQKMFNRAFNRVNTFVDFRTDLVEGSLKRAGEELEQEITKKQKVDEDKDTAELQSLMEVIPNEEEVAIDVVPLATKPPTIFVSGNDLQCCRKKPFTPPTITDMLNKKLQVDYFSEMYKVNAAEGVNAASEEVSTAELLFMELFASNKGDAPAKTSTNKSPQTHFQTSNCLSQKMDYDPGQWRCEIILEYIDNESWKVNQNGTQRTRNALEKRYAIGFQKLPITIGCPWVVCPDEDANHKFLRSLPPAWDSLAMTMRTKKNIDTLSIDDLYNNLSVFEQDIQKTSSSSHTSDNVAFLSQAKASSSKHKQSHSSGSYSSYPTSSSKATPTATPGLADEVIHSFLATNADDVDLIHEDLDQIDDLDLEEMDINWQIAMTAIKIKKFYKKTGRRPRVDGKMHVAFDKRKVECFNCHNTGHFARECKFKGSKEGSRQEASRGQDFKPVRTEKEALMTIDEGQINWVEQTTDEELNHALMAFTVNNEVLGYEEEISRGIFAFRETNAGYNDIPLYSRFKQVEYKGVPHPLSGDYTPREQEDIDDSLYEYGKYGPQPQSPSPIESDASSTVSSTCQSNDSDGEQGTVSDHSVNDDPIPIPSSEQVSTSIQKTQPQVPKPQQTVDPSCAQHVKTPRQQIRTPVTPSPIPSYNRQNWNQRMERELGAGYSFERKPCFVCGSLSHLIKDCDYYEKKMAREAALKSKKVVHADVRQATPAWTNTNRVNKANQFTPRPVQLSNIRPNLSTASNTIKTGRVNVNTGHGNVSSGRVYVNTGTQFKSGGSRFNTGHGNVNSGRVHVNTARVNRPVLSNQTSQDHPLKHMEHRDSMNYIPVSVQNQANPAGSKEVIDIDVQTEEDADLMVVSSTSLSEKIATKKTHSPRQPSSTPISNADHEEEVFSDADDDEMPEIRIYDKSSEGIFEKASYDDEGIISDFNNLPDEVSSYKSHLRITMLILKVKSLRCPIVPVQTRSTLKKITEAHALYRGYPYKHTKEAIIKINNIVFFASFRLHLNQGKSRTLKMEAGEAMQEELCRSSFNKYWFLVDFYPMDAKYSTKWYTGTKRYEGSSSRIEAISMVAEILKKFDRVHVKACHHSHGDQVALTKDEEALIDYGGPILTEIHNRWLSILGQRLISCNARTTIVATSTTEANMVLLQWLWTSVVVQNQLLTKFTLMNTKIHIDNESTICIVKNPVYHSKTKHIEIRHHFIRDCYEKKLIHVEKIHTDLNVADLLTKPFDGPRFNYLVVSIGKLSRFCNLGSKFPFNPGFAEIVDFLRGSNLSATVDTKRYIISEASIRDSLQLDDATGISMLPNDDLFQGMGQIGYPTDGTFTFWKSFFTPQWRYLVHHLLHCISSKSGGWDQFGSNIATALICPKSTGRSLKFFKFILDGNARQFEEQEKVFDVSPGFQGAPRPLLPSMLLVATNPIAGQEHAVQAQTQPIPPPPPIPSPTPTPIPTSTSPPPIIPSPTPPPIPTPTSPPPPPPETEPPTDEHIYEEHSPVHHHFSPSQAQAPSHMPTDDLLQTVPKLISRIDSLELDLKQTKLTMGNAIVKLVKKVKKLEGFLKRRNLVLTDSEDEEPEAHASGEEQEEEIRPNTLEAAKTLSKVAHFKSRSIDKEGAKLEANAELQRAAWEVNFKEKTLLEMVTCESRKNSLLKKASTKIPKRLKEDKDDEAKDDEPTKKLGKRRKQIARKGMHTSVDENVSDDSDKVDEQRRD
ncbi:putative ribonuclease H-like domain-containing protein [Tanacetum coccineum]